MEMVHRAWGCTRMGWRKVQVTLVWVSMQQVMGLSRRGLEVPQVGPRGGWQLVSSKQVKEGSLVLRWGCSKMEGWR